MKKLFIAFVIFLNCISVASAGVVTVDVFITSDDVTISHLEQFRTRVVGAINNADGANIQHHTISQMKWSWGP